MLGRFRVLGEIAANSIRNLHQRSSRICLGQVVIDLVNTWAEFCRAYYLSAAMEARLLRGGRIGVQNLRSRREEDAIALVMKAEKSWKQPDSGGSYHRRDEPPWHDGVVFTRACRLLGASTSPHVDNAISIGTSTLRDAPVARNFFAHRNRRSFQALQRVVRELGIPLYGVAGKASTHAAATTLLARPLPSSPIPLIIAWVDDYEVVADLITDA